MSHNIAHTCCMLDQQGYRHAHAHEPGHTHARLITHKQICNTAFPRQQSLRECVSMLRYTYIACLVIK
jgi:hypothetical protein